MLVTRVVTRTALLYPVKFIFVSSLTSRQSGIKVRLDMTLGSSRWLPGFRSSQATTVPAMRPPETFALAPRDVVGATLRDVTEATALSRSVIYDLMAESRFPKPIRVGDRAVRWIEDEVIEYIASRPRAGSERSA